MNGRWLGATLALALLAQGAATAGPLRVRLKPRQATVAATVSERFVSFAVDMDHVVGGTFWDPAGGTEQVDVDPYDFGRTRLRALTAALAPAYLRLGGSASDGVFYDLSGTADPVPPAGYEEVLTREQWDAASAFARELGLELVVTVNAGPGPRDDAGRWTDANARGLLEYVAAHGDPVAVVEFGNEPNLFAIRAGLPRYDATDYARDLTTFKDLQQAVLPAARLFAPGNIYTRTRGENVIGDVVFGPRATEMLPLVGSFIDGLEYHYYGAVSMRCPPVGPRVDPTTALDRAYLDGIDEAGMANDALRDAYVPGRPIWLTESGGQSCGGQIGLADRFLNSFWYLNTLGRLARRGHEVVVRQTLSGGTYGLLDDDTLAPNPDYWAALLWRRLMGRTALALRREPTDPRVATFVHCTRGGAPGSVTVLALNLDRARPLKLRIRGIRRRRPADVHLVTAADPAARAVLLNGAPLEAGPDGTPPAFEPTRSRRRMVALPPLSYAFVVVPGARAAACGYE